MKKKILGVFSVILVLTLCVFVYNPQEVSAGVSDQSCKQVDAYLYFSDTQWTNVIIDHAKENNGTYTYITCSTKDGISNGVCQGKGTFNIDFSELGISDTATIKPVTGSGEVVNITNLKEFWTVMTNYDEGTTVEGGKLYVKHGAWSNKDKSNQDASNGIFTVDELTKSSITGISSVISSSFEQSGKSLLGTFKVQRIYKQSVVEKMVEDGNIVYRKNANGEYIDSEGNVIDESNPAHIPIVQAPMLYKMQFEICEQNEIKNPTLTIRYWYDEVGGKQAADDHKETLASGSKYDVTSPSINGYSPDKDVVRGTMPDEDVIIDVIYTPKTGGVAMGFIWFIGLGALGYGIYYYNRTTREQEEI